MSSPFKNAANGLLVFHVGSTTFTKDEAGIQIPGDRLLAIKVSMTLDTQKQTIAAQAGQDLATTHFLGCCVEPKFIPTGIKILDQADCTLTDLATGAKQQGRFTLTSIVQSRWKAVTKSLGSSFEGFVVGI